jgi:hypothetical protein
VHLRQHNYDAARCKCIREHAHGAIDFSDAAGGLCVVVARGVRVGGNVQLGAGDDCFVNGGRMVKEISLGKDTLSH